MAWSPGPPAHQARPSREPQAAGAEPIGRRLRPYWGLGAAAAVVALLGILSVARWGASVPQPESTRGGAGEADASGPAIDTAGRTSASAESGESTAVAPGAEGDRSSTPSATTSSGSSRAPTPAQGAATYRGTSILLLVWSEGGDPSSAATAETALLDELRSRGLAVADPATLQLLGRDPAARATAASGDAAALADLARRHGAAVLLTASLRTGAEPSVGRFYTGTAVLDVRAYRIADAELLEAETYRVGAGGTPGELGPTALAAETEAARAVGTRAAVGLARDLGSELPRRR